VRTVARISITPVKAMALQHPSQVELEPFGVRANRRFYLVGRSLEQVSGPMHGRLVQVRATYAPQDEWLRLDLPDGSVAEGRTDEVEDEQLTTDFYGRPVAGHVVIGPFSKAISGWYGQDLRLARTDLPGMANDVHPLSMMSLASASALASASESDRPLETRRFRMLFELDGCEPFEEDTWRERLLRIGDAAIRVGGQIPRCAVTTYDPDSGIRDFSTLHAIKHLRGVNASGNLPFGVYGEVVEPGSVRVGDRAEPLD
jgi:uncharacterized protein YcbX